MRLTKLHVRWIGHPPRVGDYLRTVVRPRYAYRVEQVINLSSKVYWDSVVKAEAWQLQIGVARVLQEVVPRHARVHPWKWDKRTVSAGLSSFTAR